MVWSGGRQVSVCLRKEKRKKRGSWPKERREVGENEWWGVGLGGGTCGPQKKKKADSYFSFLFFIFILFEWDVTVSVCAINLSMVWKLRGRK